MTLKLHIDTASAFLTLRVLGTPPDGTLPEGMRLTIRLDALPLTWTLEAEPYCRYYDRLRESIRSKGKPA
jgi:hypothetical protein